MAKESAESGSKGRKEPTVFVVDDDDAVRDYLKWLMQSVSLQVELFSTAKAFLDAYDPSQCGCVLLDVRMPGLSGFDLQTEMQARRIRLPVIMMTAYAEVPMAVRALRGGAVDFIEKPLDGQVLLDRVQQAIANDQANRRAEQERFEVQERLARLTPRQRAVLEGLIAGKPSKIIAAELGVSASTVDVHRGRLMQRLQARSLPDLFRLVLLTQEPEA
jgi:two-component system, LuxR family, response regulator FixJ